MTELTRLPKIELEKVPETYDQCSNCYIYIYNGYAQCPGLEPDCVLRDCQYYEPMFNIKESN